MSFISDLNNFGNSVPINSGLKDLAKSVFSDQELAAERALITSDKPLPEFFTGARAKVLVNGSPIGAALEVNWNVSTNVEEIRTIDSSLPWELVPGQIQIKASLKRWIHPDRSLAGDGMFSTIASLLHQPYVSLELRDRLGNIIFYAKGMFVSMNGTVGNNTVGVQSVDFIGYYFRENVNQSFEVRDQKGVSFDLSKNSAIKKFSNFSI